MNKLIALICVISWSGFWDFGYLALSASADSQHLTVATILAAIGFLSGTCAYIALGMPPP